MTSAIPGNHLKQIPPSSSNFEEGRTVSKVLVPPLPRCKTHDGLAQLHSIRRPWDAWERRSLKKQVRDAVCRTTSNSSGYSRGPEFLKALEKLKSRSHS